MWLIIIAGVLIVLIYLKLTKNNKYWEEKGIVHLKPWPLVGNMASIFFQSQSMAHKIEELYKAYPEERYIGFHQFLKPTLLIRDPEIIKQVTVRDFDIFPEHQTFAPEGIDSIWDRNLFAMKGGDKWHDMRATLSPTFTSSKMKAMFVLMKECAKQFTSYFQKQEGIVTVEMKDIFTRFASDVIGNTAFGVTCDSLQNPENDVYLMGKDINDVSGLRALIFFLHSISPSIMKIFKITVIRAKVATFFRGLIKETIKLREEKGIVRPDMVHLLMEAKKGRLKHDDQSNVVDSGFAVAEESELGRTQKRQKMEITDDDITAQAVVFFLAGFDTSSTLMSYISYELAVNPDIQQKLVQQIDSALEKCNGDITYEALLEIKYLDMVTSETLRKWTPAEFTDRLCTKTYTIEAKNPGEKTLILDADTNCWIPIYGIHRDPQYYRNPDKFDPERFSDKNKSNIKPFTFMPFGVGPRSCIGSRFALLETKLIICELLSKFQIVPVEKTQIPLLLKKGTIGMLTEKGIWLGLKLREVSSL